ncbi:MAG: hypothetical protein ACTSSJ_02460 [Candidatus Odinarchaeia archaeon]
MIPKRLAKNLIIIWGILALVSVSLFLIKPPFIPLILSDNMWVIAVILIPIIVYLAEIVFSVEQRSSEREGADEFEREGSHASVSTQILGSEKDFLKELLTRLTEKYEKGEISEELYIKLKEKYKKELEKL